MTAAHTVILRTLCIVSVIALMSTLPACSGGGAKVESDITTTSKGQQLIDLKKALDTGAISQKEYDTLRKKIIQD
jgi:hypothetical protein